MTRGMKVLAMIGALIALLVIAMMLLLNVGQDSDGGGHRPRFDHGMVEAA